MDAEGARELTRRIGANIGVAIRPVPAEVSEGALSLYRWFDGAAAASVAQAPPPKTARRRRAPKS